MLSNATIPDFTTLLTHEIVAGLFEQLDELVGQKTKDLQQDLPKKPSNLSLDSTNIKNSEQQATDWLIEFFNALFIKQKVELVRGNHEPEYFPAINDNLARIEFAHGFFASALHELSHWCIAGFGRRKRSDFGYWYAADGRSEAQQLAFERVEIRPQALECLFTLACKRDFQVSQDNLFATFDTSASTFATDVYYQAKHYIDKPQSLPADAKTLLRALLLIHDVPA